MTLPILDTLVVWWDARQAGELSIDKGGAMHFAYAPEWLADENGLVSVSCRSLISLCHLGFECEGANAAQI